MAVGVAGAVRAFLPPAPRPPSVYPLAASSSSAWPACPDRASARHGGMRSSAHLKVPAGSGPGGGLHHGPSAAIAQPVEAHPFRAATAKNRPARPFFIRRGIRFGAESAPRSRWVRSIKRRHQRQRFHAQRIICSSTAASNRIWHSPSSRWPSTRRCALFVGEAQHVRAPRAAGDPAPRPVQIGMGDRLIEDRQAVAHRSFRSGQRLIRSASSSADNPFEAADLLAKCSASIPAGMRRRSNRLCGSAP